MTDQVEVKIDNSVLENDGYFLKELEHVLDLKELNGETYVSKKAMLKILEERLPFLEQMFIYRLGYEEDHINFQENLIQEKENLKKINHELGEALTKWREYAEEKEAAVETLTEANKNLHDELVKLDGDFKELAKEAVYKKHSPNEIQTVKIDHDSILLLAEYLGGMIKPKGIFKW